MRKYATLFGQRDHSAKNSTAFWNLGLFIINLKKFIYLFFTCVLANFIIKFDLIGLERMKLLY